VISLSAEYGRDRACSDPLALIAEVTASLLLRFCP
jgi:hypothetical protein